MAQHRPHRTLASPLARVRGLGSAKEGVSHWWAERVSGAALIPLTLWFVYSVVMLAGADQDRVRAWLSRPASAILMSLLIVATFHHAALGTQVVIEDYVHREGVKMAAILLVKGLAVLLAASALFAVLRVALGA
jgi:succinate dehydrogenase / fumarate reductase membrane anchor subunit